MDKKTACPVSSWLAIFVYWKVFYKLAGLKPKEDRFALNANLGAMYLMEHGDDGIHCGAPEWREAKLCRTSSGHFYIVSNGMPGEKFHLFQSRVADAYAENGLPFRLMLA